MLGMLAGLVACQSLPPPPAMPGNWLLKGDLLVRSPAPGARLHLVWKQEAGHYSIRFRNRFGLILARIDGGPQQVVLKRLGKRELRANSAEELFLEVFGWELPIGNLAYWLAGDLRGGEVTGFDEHGNPAGIRADGWQLQLSDWQSTGGFSAPDRFHLEGPAARLELLVKSRSGEAPEP